MREKNSGSVKRRERGGKKLDGGEEVYEKGKTKKRDKRSGYKRVKFIRPAAFPK